MNNTTINTETAAKEFLSFMGRVEELISGNESFSYGENSFSSANESIGELKVNSPVYNAVTDYNNIISPADFKTCRRIWQAVTDFMNNNNIIPGNTVEYHSMDSIGLESLDRGASLAGVGADALNRLCDDAGISSDPAVRRSMCAELALILQRMFSYNTNDTYRIAHYVNARESYNGSGHLDNYGSMYPTSVLSDMQMNTLVPSSEAFGANIDKVITDTRMTIAITMLRFHKSLLNRMMHRRQRATTIVEYEVPYAESYDLHKSMNPDDVIREGREHRSIMLDLYRNPSPVTQKLTPLFPLKANDDRGVLVEDGIIAIGQKANLITLSLDENKIGQDHADWTDLVSEGVCFDKLYFTLSDGSTTEQFVVSMNHERLVPTAQNRDSSYRAGNYLGKFKLHAGTVTASGGQSTLLAGLTETDCLVVELSLNGGIYLKNGYVQASGFASLSAYAANGAEPSETVTTLLGKAKTAVTGYSVYAFYSEENLRRSNIAFRTNKFMRAYEIMCGRNYMVDYSLNQVLPEYVMSIVTEGMSLGMDDRAMNLFEENAKLVYDRVQSERRDDGYLEHLDRINFDYVAGTRVYPWVHIDSIDMRDVDTIRSSDYMSDVRQFFDTRLTRIMSLVHANSLYRQQLEPGEAPTYKLVTSNIILENLFAVPHIHNHIEQMERKESDGEVVEYTRVLPSGIVLQCITSPWDKMRDKIFIVPFRPSYPDSELNYGHNWDYGTFLAHYTPQIAMGVNKRLFCNARETPIITNPVAVSLTIVHFDDFIDLSYVSGVTP